MPRGVKRTPEQVLNSQIEVVEQKMEKASSQLNKLKAQHKTLMKQRKELELAQLREAIAASGQSVQDVLNLIKKDNKKDK